MTRAKVVYGGWGCALCRGSFKDDVQRVSVELRTDGRHVVRYLDRQCAERLMALLGLGGGDVEALLDGVFYADEL